MNYLLRTTLPLVIVGLLTSGCAKKQAVDTAQLQRAFQTAEPTRTNAVQQIVTAVKDHDHTVAMTALQKLAHQSKLTSEQQHAIREVMTQVQLLMMEAAQHPQPTNAAARPPAR